MDGKGDGTGKGDVLQIISFDALEPVFAEESYNLKYVPIVHTALLNIQSSLTPLILFPQGWIFGYDFDALEPVFGEDLII